MTKNKIDELIQKMKKNNDNNVWAEFLQEFAEKAKFYIVTEYDKNNKINYKVIKNSQNNLFLPIFTNFDEFKEFGKVKNDKSSIEQYDFDKINEIIISIPNLAGIVINPFSDNFIVQLDLINDLKKTKENRIKNISAQNKKEVKIEEKIIKSETDLSKKENNTENYFVNKFRNLKGNSETKKYDFKFVNHYGLRYVSDKMLEICYQLIEKGNFNITTDTKTNKIIVNNNVIGLCDYKYTTEDLYKGLEKGILGENKIFKENSAEFVRSSNLDVNDCCLKCKFEKCPKFLSAYILCLKNNDLLEKELLDREEFRKNNKVSNYFTFEWDAKELLKMVSETDFKFAKKLVDNEYVVVKNILNSSDRVLIYSSLRCSDYKRINCDESFIKARNTDNYSTYISRGLKQDKMFCTSYNCRLNSCPINIAGYIYYLKKRGQEEIIREARDYYSSHKQKMQLKILEQKEAEIKNSEKIKIDFKKDLEFYKEKIYNFNELIDIVSDKSQKSLHCILEDGEENDTKYILDKIINTLKKCDKINPDKAPNRTRLESLGRSLVFYENTNSWPMQIKKLNENELYIIDGISEFIKDYKRFNKDPYFEIKYKACQIIVDELSKLKDDYYIILIGKKSEIDEFISLDNRLKFVFQDYRFEISQPKFNDLFGLYKKSVKSDLLGELRQNEDKYQKEFENYVSLNKSLLPFNNQELVNYLAMYSNLRNKIIFPENMYKKETVEESLKNIIGLDIVKSKVKEFEKYMLFNVKAKASLDLKLGSSNMHMIFTGNPGTGKTTIARIMAKMLFDLGLIRENKIIEVERKDLVAAYIGQTAIKTAEVIEKAKGGVLFIDEAYSLAPKTSSDYGSEAVSTIIKSMEDFKDELVVIFAGYRKEMQAFLDINPGIASRIGYKFDFPDYNAEELTEIFKIKMTNSGFKLDNNVLKEVNKICSFFVNKKDFGNARFIDKLIQETVMKHAISETNDKIDFIVKEEIPSIEELNNVKMSGKSEVEKSLQNIIGMTELKKQIKNFEAYVKFIKLAQEKEIELPNQNMHMIFTGNPGTGKTTIARIMAQMLFDMGIIHENKLIEVERKDLVAEYIGQTAVKTTEVIERAMGGVLFIDEAYSLAPKQTSNDFGAEAISTLIKAMEDHKDNLIVIFAGYKKEMQDFINQNSGIASRIGYNFDFPDYTDKELEEILYKKIEKTKMTISEDAKKEIPKIMKYFCNVENFGNGRFVDKVFQEILVRHSKNIDRDITIIEKDDIPSIQDITKIIVNGSNMIDPSRITKDAQKRTAVHEIGHAVVRMILFEKPGIKKITINAEGTGTLGYVLHSLENEGYTSGKTVLKNRIKVSLAGMAAEQVYFGEFENGNYSDLQNATAIAKNMVTRYGMSNLGFAQIDSENGEIAVLVQKEINEILDECFKDTVQIIENSRDKMNKVVKYLYKNKEINEQELLDNFK